VVQIGRAIGRGVQSASEVLLAVILKPNDHVSEFGHCDDDQVAVAVDIGCRDARRSVGRDID